MIKDNRSEYTRYLDDVHALERAASVLMGLVSKSFDLSRAVARSPEGTYTFMFSSQWLDDLDFMATDVWDRAVLLNARSKLIMVDEDGLPKSVEVGADSPAEASDRWHGGRS